MNAIEPKRALTCAKLALVSALLAGCAMPAARVEKNIEDMKPLAAETAKERAQSDLACGSVKTAVLDHDAGDMGKAYALNRVEYTVRAAGCGRATDYKVACTPKGVCSAMAGSGIVERE